MRVVILGGTGMLGHEVYRVLSKAVETHVTVRRPDENLLRFVNDTTSVHAGVTAENIESIRAVLATVQPTVVINCIGIIKQQSTAKSATSCIEVNALFPHRLAEECEARGVSLIHISTDCVFSGIKGDYVETDPQDAQDLYGRSKALGEVDRPNTLTIRTSVVGTALNDNLSLFDWFVSTDAHPVKGFTQAIYTGLTTTYLAKEILQIIGRPFISGVWQIAAQKISKYELLRHLDNVLALGKTIVPSYDFKCDRSLNCSRYTSATGFVPPSWNEMLADYAADRRENYAWKKR